MSDYLNDPDAHFPYKLDAALEGDLNPDYGKTMEDGRPYPTAHIERWTVDQQEAHAIHAYVEAQAASLAEPEDEKLAAAVVDAAHALAAVRRSARASRGPTTVGGNAFISGV